MASGRLFRLLFVSVFGACMAFPASVVVAQGTPEANANPFTELGLPQLDISVTDMAFEGVPSELDAGRYVIALTNNMTEGDGTQGGAFMQVPAEMTTEQFLEMAAPVEETGEDETAADEEAVQASPTGEDDDSEIPEWYYDVVIAGGPYAAMGETAYAVVDLMAGEWVFWAEYPGAPQAPMPVTVTGEMPVDLPTPTSDFRIEMSEFDFEFEGQVASGPQVVEIANTGDQPHFIGMAMLPSGTTEQDLLGAIEAAFSGGEDATPAATPEGGLSFDDIVDVFGTGDQSSGVTTWYSIDLEPGTHGAVCFVTDPESGMPHAMLGMIEIFEVS